MAKKRAHGEGSIYAGYIATEILPVGSISPINESQIRPLTRLRTPDDHNLQLMTLDEAGGLLKVNPTTIGRRIQRGEIAAVHIGRSVRIRKIDLEKFILDHLQK
jgi:excisionase family DNA binding protein